MLYRATAFLIVLFWLTMTALLIHQEIRPGDSALREIPVSHVVKLFFLHHQDDPGAPLGIYSGKDCLGHLRLKPQIDEKTQNHNLTFNGELQLTMLGGNGKRERVAWKGEWEMDKLLTTRRFKLAVTTHSPGEFTSQIEILPAENIAHYELLASNGTLEREDFTLDKRGLRAALNDMAIDPSLLSIAEKQQAAAKPPTIKARLSSLLVHGESMDTYLITIESNGQTLLECHVDQLGHVVYVTTLLGYTLSADDVTP